MQRQAVRTLFLVVGAGAVVATSFVVTLTILNSFGQTGINAFAAFSASIREFVSPREAVLSSKPLDIQHMLRQTGSIVDGTAIASAPKDHAGWLLIATDLKFKVGSYRVTITFSCKNNKNPNVFDIVTINPSSKVNRLELSDRSAGCDGSVKDVAFEFKVTRPPESFQIRFQYGGTGTLQINKIVLQSLAD